MFSFSKLIALVLLIAGVLLVLRWIEGRREERRRMRPPPRRKPVPAAEELVQCRVCGIYGPADKGRQCSRSDCPY